MNQNSWHGRKDCSPGYCKFGCSQCPECHTCLSTMDPPTGSHDDDCQTGIAWDEHFREQMEEVAMRIRLKRTAAINEFED